MTTVQLNARLDRNLKESGDEALLLIGLSPTKAVRALWEKASRRGADLKQIEALLCDSSRPVADVGYDDVLAQGWAFMEEAYSALGMSLSIRDDMSDDDDLLEEALLDRLSERGLA